MSDQNSEWPEGLGRLKKEIAQKMIAAVTEWDETADRNINYRSLSPIINLLKCHHCPEAQTWAAWALASLTNADQTEKYRQLTLEEGGFDALKELVKQNETTDFVREKAQRVITRVQQYLDHQRIIAP
jgi:hypothetical protein